MPQVTISVIEVKCLKQDDRTGDDVYWIRNLRCSGSISPDYMDKSKIYVDAHYLPGLPTMLSIGTGDTKQFPDRSGIVFEQVCPYDSYVYGTVHLMEREAPFSELFGRLLTALSATLGLIAGMFGSSILGAIVISLLVGGTVAAGAASGFAMAAGITLAASLTALLVALMLEAIRQTTKDEHLAAIRVEIGPLVPAVPPPVPPPPQITTSGPIYFPQRDPLVALDANNQMICTYKAAGGEYMIRLQVEIRDGRALGVLLQ